MKSAQEGEGKYKGETWEDGYKRRVVKTIRLGMVLYTSMISLPTYYYSLYVYIE